MVLRIRLACAVLLLVAAGGGAWAAVATGKPPTIRVTIAGRTIDVPRGTSVLDGARRRGVAPRSGDLLDVEGNVLRAARFPGRFEVNGRPAQPGTTLRPGDRVAVRDGTTRTEALTREISISAMRRPANPQFYVDLVPGRSIVTRGAVSHQLVAARFVPDGPAVPDDAVALTFDDGPSEYTRRFVDLLTELHVPATFFVIGMQAAEHPELVRLEADAGMVVGNHSYSHPWRTPFAQLPAREIAAEIDRGHAVLQRIGVRSVLFRPPGGTVSPGVLRTAAGNGEHIVLWSVDARDWVAGTTAAEIEQRVLDAVRPGSIVVMHDGGGDREATLAALPGIVAGIRSRGLRFVALAPQG